MRIALIGSAPSSVQLAPYADPSWTIWSCSPGAAPLVRRCNAHFELHRWEPPEGYTGPKPWFTPDYIKWMANINGPVYMLEPVPQIPNSVAYPKDAILEEFGPYYQASTLSWMVCLAVAAGATEIGLWGVDMAAREEWTFQRTSLQCLLWYLSDANKRSPYKIKITIPPESDLWVPPVLYGFCESNPHFIKLLTKKFEFSQRYHQAKARLEEAQREFTFFEGAADNNDYAIATWCQDPKAVSMAFSKPTRATVPLDPVLAELTVPQPNGHDPDLAKMAAAIERVDGAQVAQ